MDWQNGMNQAIDYLESHLGDEIDYLIAARYMRCSVWEFQRLFSLLAQIPLSEYIRRRRLTLAAHDIQVKGDRIIDVAMRYGYDSPAAFSRAFRQMHGITPKESKEQDRTLKAFPRLSFQFTIKGAEIMAYRIIRKEAFQIIGETRRMTTVGNAHYQGIGRFWEEWNRSGICKKLSKKYGLGPEHCIDISTPCENPEEFDYTIGFLYNGTENCDNLNIVMAPGGTYAIFTIPEEDRNNIGDFMSRVITEYLPSLRYELCGVDAEYFSQTKCEAWFLVK